MTDEHPLFPVNPSAARDANERGAALAHQGRYLEAAAALDEACRFDPHFADAYSNLGAVLRRLGDLDGAIDRFEEAIRLQPDFAAAHYNLGNAYGLQGDKSAAAAAYRNALAHRADYAEAWNNLARLLNDSGHHEEALEACLEGLQHAPDNPHLRNNTGNAYQGLGCPKDALREYRRAVEIAPQMNEAFSNLGVVLKEVGDVDAALEAHRKAIELAPEDVPTLNNYGTALQAANRVDDAIAVFRRAQTLAPDSLATSINLGTALMGMNAIDAAIETFGSLADTVVLGDETPEHALAHKNLGLSLMLKGELARGAKHYAWRWRTREFTPRELETPLWGGEDLDGENVFVHWEQGFGDAVQFARFAEQIAARGGRVTFEAPAPLAPLLKSAPGIDSLLVHGETPPADGVHIPMFDLLSALTVDMDSLPGPVPYLSVDPERAERWTDRIPDTGRMRVGLVWAGRPTHGNDRNRSVSLDLFLPLLRQTSVDFYALQVGDRVSDIATAGLENDLIDLSPKLSDFAETAAALEQLDLLISVDTAVVHVAGALGRPVWALIPFAPDWRWGLETDKSPWYPSITLIRQETPGDWAPVIERIDAALGKKARRR